MAGLIAAAFEKVASDHADRVAVFGLSENLSRTFSDLRADIEALRPALKALGLPARPTVVSNVGNRTGFIPLFVASLDLNAAVLLIDGDAPPAEVLRTADAHAADLIVVSADSAAFSPLVPSLLPCGLAAIVRPRRDGPTWRAESEDGGLVLKLTSGSTSAPKVVVASEHNIVSDGQHVIEAMDITSADIGLASVPMAHSYGLGNLLLPLLLAGSPIALRDRFLPAQWASDVVACGATMFPGVPFIYDYLRRLGDDAGAVRRLRLLVTAGAPIDFEILTYFKDRFGAKIHSLYGTSETGSIAFDSSDELYDPVSVGWAVPETSVTLLTLPDLSPHEGQLSVQGSAVSRGYAFPEPGEEHASGFTPDGFLTADLATRTGDGRLTLVGRVSGFVNVAGRKVHPREVERVIAQLAAVAHVSVFGLASGARGEELVACVERRNSSLSAAVIRRHCAAALSPYKVPRRIVFVDELPVDQRGKILRDRVETALKTVPGETEDL